MYSLVWATYEPHPHLPIFQCIHVHSCDSVDPIVHLGDTISGGKYSPIMAETKLEIEDFSHRWLPIKDVLTYFPFCPHNYKRLNLALIYQVDNRTGWVESVTLHDITEISVT